MGLGKIFDPVLRFSFPPVAFPTEAPKYDTENDIIAKVEDLLQAESDLRTAMQGKTMCAPRMIQLTNLLIAAQETREKVYQSDEWKAAWSRTC